ncbi:MAG: glycogen synthase [Defluviitaleaceae bacterium]|nr:glycogen synthase [Defluviitaleaceae bacterium]
MALKVLMVASELSPYAKTGGLGEVIGVLTKELRNQGVDARAVFPKYKNLSKFNHLTQICNFPVNINFQNHDAIVFSVDDKKNHIYTIENDYFFLRDNMYGYDDDYFRFYFFTLAVFEFIKQLDFKPDIIHFNDWQVGLGSFYLKESLSDNSFYSNISTIFSIHNIQHQGNFEKDILEKLGIEEYYFNPNMIELYDKVSFMKAGILYSDAITTVSENYAKEIQTPFFSFGLDGVISSRKEDLYGIVNGIEYNDVDNFKTKNKKYLQQKMGLPIKDVPIVSIVTRLAEQKGIDIIVEALNEIVNKDLQLIILGVGEEKYEKIFLEYDEKHENVTANIYFDTDISIDIYKHSDIFLMPSLFEPCGIAQMISMKYGTVPIVRKTGGLKDTVIHFDTESKCGNGFVFEDYNAEGLLWAFDKALETYKNKEDWSHVVSNALNTKFSSEDTAKKYIELYKKVLKNKKLNCEI